LFAVAVADAVVAAVIEAEGLGVGLASTLNTFNAARAITASFATECIFKRENSR
jgi:ABC-type proline/glycine betaine transport system permease subunit